LRARELDANADVIVLVADAFPNYSICGLPFYVSGETPDWHQLAHRTLDELQAAGLHILLDHQATAIEPSTHEAQTKDGHGATRILAYDRLVIATGAQPVRPPIVGLDLSGVYVLHTMQDSFRLHDAVTANTAKSATIVGSGYIGLETADALTQRGVEVTLIGRSQSVLPTVDPPFGALVAEELRRHGVEVITGVAVEAIERDGSRLAVRAANGVRTCADLVLVAAGVLPNGALAASAGVETGINGAICVDRHMRTSVPGIYAAGDCVETWHRILQRVTYLPLGTASHNKGALPVRTQSGVSACLKARLAHKWSKRSTLQLLVPA
jgi:NADPH-dependent 2,4-dienoyl-CoA reductase/sulfur reductase-like enzyme